MTPFPKDDEKDHNPEIDRIIQDKLDRIAEDRELTRACMELSEISLGEVWNNDADDAWMRNFADEN
jgi:predicted transcriptional regulator